MRCIRDTMVVPVVQHRLDVFTGRSYLDIAAERVRRFVESYEPPFIYVFFSGGKDSAAALAATVYAGESVTRRMIVVYNELMGNTARVNVENAMRILRKLGLTNIVAIESPPYSRVTKEVERIIREGSTPAVLHIRAYSRHREDFWGAVSRWGIPVLLRSGSRWCYSEFKEKHWRALPPASERERYVIVGVKMFDSSSRMKRWRRSGGVTRYRINSGITDTALSPIYDFTTDHVMLLLREAGIDKDVMMLYERYGDSLNCVFCPLRALGKQERIVEMIAREEPEILERALEALERIKPRPGTKTYELATQWKKIIESVLHRR